MGSGVVWVGSMGDGGHEMKCDSVMYQIKIHIYIYMFMVCLDGDNDDEIIEM